MTIETGLTSLIGYCTAEFDENVISIPSISGLCPIKSWALLQKNLHPIWLHTTVATSNCRISKNSRIHPRAKSQAFPLTNPPPSIYSCHRLFSLIAQLFFLVIQWINPSFNHSCLQPFNYPFYHPCLHPFNIAKPLENTFFNPFIHPLLHVTKSPFT